MLTTTGSTCPVESYTVATWSHLTAMSITTNWSALLDPDTCTPLPTDDIHNMLIRVYMSVYKKSPFIFNVIGKHLMCAPLYMNVYSGNYCTDGSTSCEQPATMCINLSPVLTANGITCRFKCDTYFFVDRVYIQIHDWEKPNTPEICELT